MLFCSVPKNGGVSFPTETDSDSARLVEFFLITFNSAHFPKKESMTIKRRYLGVKILFLSSILLVF